MDVMPHPLLAVDINGRDVLDWFIDGPVRIVVVIVVAFLLTRIVDRSIERFATKLMDEAEESAHVRGIELGARARQRTFTVGSVLTSVAHVVIWVVVALVVLGELNINLAPLIASAGVAGIAFGFGAQSLVRDFLAGIFFLIEDQFGVGDVVDLGPSFGVIGVVEEVTLRTTRLRDVDGVQWIIPNGEIRQLGNASQTWSRAVLDFGVSYDTDIDHAMEVIGNTLRARWEEGVDVSRIIEEPLIQGVQSFDADAVTIRALVKTQPAAQYAVARELRALIKHAFDAEGIEIPFPQRTVWLKSDPT